MTTYIGEAVGLVETLGMVPAIKACDEMLKAADVQLVAYENVGSTLVTIIVRGDIAACEASVKAGVEAANKIGKVTSSNVMRRPDAAVTKVVEAHDINEG